MVAGLNQAFGALCRVLEEDRPGTAARLLAAFEEAEDDPVESYSARVTEKMPSMLGCIQEFLLGIGKFTSPRIARSLRRRKNRPQYEVDTDVHDHYMQYPIVPKIVPRRRLLAQL